MMSLVPSLAAATIAQAQAAAPVEVTIYNGGFGFVKEVRSLSLPAGVNEIAVQDVTSTIEANSVGIRALSGPTFRVLEQNYQYDLVNATEILNKAVGSTIKLHRSLPGGVRETIEGTLMSAPTAIVNAGGGQQMTYNGLVLKTADGRIFLNPRGEIEVPVIPEGMVSRPTLKWLVDAPQSGLRNVELSYITQGMSWLCDYILTIDGSGKADIRGWVSLTNNSGKTFKDARLKLIAGDVQRAQLIQLILSNGRSSDNRPAAAPPQFQSESLFEYYLYALQRPATLKDREMKQISLMEASGLKYEKKLIVDALRHYRVYHPEEGEIGTGDIKPLAQIIFLNKKENRLGMPLPKGRVKVYQRDKSGSTQMIGENSIDHTPKDERVSLAIGRSFDVRATRKRLSFLRINRRTVQETFEIELRNRKDVPEKVHVYERHYGEWTVTKTSMVVVKLDSQTMEYVVRLAPNEVQKITYTVVTKW